MEQNEIKLVKLENFSFDLNDQHLTDGVFSWSGNYVLKMKVDMQKNKIYATLYYNNVDRRIEQSKKKKGHQTLKTSAEVQEIINQFKAQQQQPKELNVQQMINQNAQQR